MNSLTGSIYESIRWYIAGLYDQTHTCQQNIIVTTMLAKYYSYYKDNSLSCEF